MNKKIKELAEQAGQIIVLEINGVPILHYYVAGDGWVTVEPLVEKLAELLITDLMQHIKDPTTYNRCVRTTFDLSVADCVKIEIFKMIEEIYGVKETK